MSYTEIVKSLVVYTCGVGRSSSTLEMHSVNVLTMHCDPFGCLPEQGDDKSILRM